MKKETIYVQEEEIDDFTKTSGSWKIKGETYKFIEDIETHSDGEGHEVIVQRKSDGKYFKFEWVYTHSQNYIYEPKWIEVIPKVVSKTIWK